MQLYNRLLYAKYPHLHEIAGPPPQFPLGNLATMGAGPLWQVCQDLVLAHGPYARLWAVNQPIVCQLLNDQLVCIRDNEVLFAEFRDGLVSVAEGFL